MRLISTVWSRALLLLAFLLPLGTLIVLPRSAASPDECTWCDRAAVVTRAENPDLPPNYKELYKIYEDCISQHFGDNNWSYDTSDPKFRTAQKACEHLHPEIDWIYANAICNRIAELYTNPCFHMLRKDIIEDYRRRGQREGWSALIKPPNYKIPEYSFEATFLSKVQGEIDKSGRPVRTSLTINLYYEGDQRELVKTWRTVSPGWTVEGHNNRLFHNPAALMRQNKPIENLLWDFEKTPIQCQIEPSKDTLEIGEMIEVKLSGFKDEKGRPSREFNRIAVKVEHGKILGGTESATKPELKIFLVADGTVKFKYMASNACESSEDTFYVYNSCDILPEKKLALENTKIHKEIAKKKINIRCPEVYARITSKRTYHHKSHDDSKYGVVTKSENNETKRLTVFVEFEKKPEFIDKEFDRSTMSLKPIRYSYKVKRYSVQSSSYEQTGTSFHSWSHGIEYRQGAFTESGSALDLRQNNPGDTMRLHLDIETNRIYQVHLPRFEATLHITGHAQSKLKELNKGIKETGIGDYERKGYISTSMPGSAENCDKVTGGDGKTSLKGECRYRNDQGRSVEEYFSSWEVKIREK